MARIAANEEEKNAITRRVEFAPDAQATRQRHRRSGKLKIFRPPRTKPRKPPSKPVPGSATQKWAISGHPSIRTGFLFPEKMAPERNSLMPSSAPGAAAPIEKKW
jgi:hypothetical protein